MDVMDVHESNIWIFKTKKNQPTNEIKKSNMKGLKQLKVWPCKYACYLKQVWADS